jgi:hypothetical protein
LFVQGRPLQLASQHVLMNPADLNPHDARMPLPSGAHELWNPEIDQLLDNKPSNWCQAALAYICGVSIR